MKLFAMNRWGGKGASDLIITSELSSANGLLSIMTNATLEKYADGLYGKGSAVDEAVKFCHAIKQAMSPLGNNSKTNFFYDTDKPETESED